MVTNCYLQIRRCGCIALSGAVIAYKDAGLGTVLCLEKLWLWCADMQEGV